LYIIKNTISEDCVFLYKRKLCEKPNIKFKLSNDKKRLFINEKRKKLISLDLTILEETRFMTSDEIKSNAQRISTGRFKIR